jgi:predicted transposase YdaD
MYSTTLIEIMARHNHLKKSASFNRILLQHYTTLYHTVRTGWDWRRTYHVWQKMNEYKQRLAVIDLLTELNTIHHVSITIQ